MDQKGDRERRRFIRHPTSIPISCRKKGHVDGSDHELRNMSCGGLAFVSGDAYVPGDVVEIEYPSLERAGTLHGEIIWTEQLASGPRQEFLSGMRFFDESAHRHARTVEQICHIETYRREQRARHGRDLGATEAAAEGIERCAGKFPR